MRSGVRVNTIVRDLRGYRLALLLWLLWLRLLKAGVCTSETRVARASGIHASAAKLGSGQNRIRFSMMCKCESQKYLEHLQSSLRPVWCMQHVLSMLWQRVDADSTLNHPRQFLPIQRAVFTFKEAVMLHGDRLEQSTMLRTSCWCLCADLSGTCTWMPLSS